VAAGDDSRFHSPLTLAAIGAAPNAAGLTLSAQQLNLEPASAAFGGVVTTAAQTFAGAKTFSQAITGSSISFTLATAADGVAVPGVVTYNSTTRTATSMGTILRPPPEALAGSADSSFLGSSLAPDMSCPP